MATTWSRLSNTASRSDRSNSRAASLAAQACARLESAGRRALARSDLSAAIALLERVSRLLPTDDPRRIELLVELGAALIERGRLAEAAPALDEAERLAAAANDQRLTSHVLIQRQFLRLAPRRGRRAGGGGAGGGHGRSRSSSASGTTSACAAHGGSRRGSSLTSARAEAAAAAWERAAVHARRAGDRHEFNESLRWIASMLWFGPTPASRGHPPLRGDARGGTREPRVRGSDPPPARMPQRDWSAGSGWPAS